MIVAAQVSYMDIITASTAASSAVEQSCCSVGGRAAPEKPLFFNYGVKRVRECLINDCSLKRERARARECIPLQITGRSHCADLSWEDSCTGCLPLTPPTALHLIKLISTSLSAVYLGRTISLPSARMWPFSAQTKRVRFLFQGR